MVTAHVHALVAMPVQPWPFCILSLFTSLQRYMCTVLCPTPVHTVMDQKWKEGKPPFHASWGPLTVCDGLFLPHSFSAVCIPKILYVYSHLHNLNIDAGYDLCMLEFECQSLRHDYSYMQNCLLALITEPDYLKQPTSALRLCLIPQNTKILIHFWNMNIVSVTSSVLCCVMYKAQ